VVKKIILGGIAAAVIITGSAFAGLFGSGTAHATAAAIGREGDFDPYNYRDELRYTGLYHEDVTNAYSLATRICGKRAMGYSSGQLMDGFIYSPDQYTVEQAVAIVRGAEWHFCPAYQNDTSDSSGPPAMV
jgi:hypothetical protein